MRYRIKGTFIEGKISGWEDVDCTIALFQTNSGIVRIEEKELSELTLYRLIENAEEFSMKLFGGKRSKKVIWYLLSSIGGYLLSFLFR